MSASVCAIFKWHESQILKTFPFLLSGTMAGSSSPPPPTYRPDDIPLSLSGLIPLIQVNPQVSQASFSLLRSF